MVEEQRQNQMTSAAKTELYLCKSCNNMEIDRHLFEHWLAVHKHRATIYDYYNADPSEQHEYYLWSWNNIEFSRHVYLTEAAAERNPITGRFSK
jgi:hypothetical protein